MGLTGIEKSMGRAESESWAPCAMAARRKGAHVGEVTWGSHVPALDLGPCSKGPGLPSHLGVWQVIRLGL